MGRFVKLAGQVALFSLVLCCASDAAITVVHPGDMQGWNFLLSDASDGSAHDNGIVTGTGALVAGPGTPPLGVGSAQFTLLEGGDSASLRTSAYGGSLLSNIAALSYSTYVTSSFSGDQAPYLQLRVDNDGNGSLDDILHFEPDYQSGYTMNVPNQGALMNGVWQTWDALAGGWWSVFNPGVAGPGSNVKTLAQYLLTFPNATVIATNGLRFVTGFGPGSWDNFNGNVDNFTINAGAGATTFDFEPVAAAVVPEAASVIVWSLIAMVAGGAAWYRRK